MAPRQLTCFKLAAWLTLVTAALHLVGHFQGPPASTDPAEAEMFRMVATHRLPVAGMQRTLGEFMDGFSLMMTLLCVAWGGLTLLIHRHAAGNVALLGASAWLNVAIGALATALSVWRFIPPPIVCFALVTLLYAAALPLGRHAPRG